MNKPFKIAIIGCGDFAAHFVQIFKSHPFVEKVFVCDIIKEKALDYQKRFDVEVTGTFEEVLANKEIDAIACFAQRHLHGPIVVNALKAGKHVYSAVPMASSVEDCEEIVKTVKETGLTYMMGETCVYYPCAMYCKKEYDKGTFGKFVYGESQYFHDLSHFPVGYDTRSESAVPPFYYPTHSTAMLLYATGARVTKVTAMGYVDKEEKTFFTQGANPWDNTFSNEFSLMQLSNGGIARVSECRRIGYKAPSSFISGFYGTKASYQYNNAQHLLTTITKDGVALKEVSDEVSTYEMTAHKNDADFKERVANHGWAWDNFSPMQDEEVARLPKEVFESKGNGHMGSHKLLVDDFCKSVYNATMPKVNAWQAFRYTVPGLIAHESALKGGVPLDVPDMGDAPKSL